ncbi:MAG: DinB family protein [Phycisphaerales bacterium]|nr:DinB family protein [Phycisphaerales bacterium]
MNTQPIIERMDRFSSVLPALVSGLSRDEALWRPDEKTWSILEVVCHLADEEAGDFRPRLQRTLAEPQVQWEGIDPEGWAVARRYREADLEEVAARFVAERQRSVVWLMGLGRVDWGRAYQHPKLGPIRAGDLLGAWSAHDALHLRQIAKRLFELAGRDAPGFETRYAGEWGA